MILTKTIERISLGGFFFLLLLHSASTFIILISLGDYSLVESELPTAIVAIPILWLLSIIFLSEAFKFVNSVNQKIFDQLVNSQAYYFLVATTLCLFSTYTLFVHLFCNQKRTSLWSKDFLFIYKLFGMFPLINFIVMYKLVRNDMTTRKVIKLYFSLALARYIYMNYKTTSNIFN